MSSYQIEYSKNFKANYAVILNITPDHLERHGTFASYVKAKLKFGDEIFKYSYMWKEGGQYSK